jgi:hypothetical protein
MEGWVKAVKNNMKTLAEELKELKTSRQMQNTAITGGTRTMARKQIRRDKK